MIEQPPTNAMDRPIVPSPVDPLIGDNVRTLLEAVAVLDGLPEAEYAAPSRLGSTLGAHFRHVLDHYLCLLEGLDSGLVHYEGRQRDGLVETDRGVALNLARGLSQRLADLSPTTLRRPLSVRCMAGELADQLHGDHPSTPSRELHFVLLHAIHHYSVLAIEMKARGYAVNPEFGVAPATIAWRRTQS